MSLSSSIREKLIVYIDSAGPYSSASISLNPQVTVNPQDTTSNFTYQLANSFNNVPYNKCVVLQCTIPKSYYLVSSYNNSFLINETIAYTATIEPGSIGSVVITGNVTAYYFNVNPSLNFIAVQFQNTGPAYMYTGTINGYYFQKLYLPASSTTYSDVLYMYAGNYNRKSFANVMQTVLNTNPDGVGLNYTVTYPNSQSTADNGLYTIAATYGITQVNPVIAISLTIIGENLAYATGFNPNTTNAFAGTFPIISTSTSASLTSVNVIKIQASDTLYIRSNMITGGTDNVLQEVFSTSDPNYAAIVYQSFIPEMYAKDIATLNITPRFWLTDQDANIIDLNGQNMQIVLCLYRDPSFNTSVQQSGGPANTAGQIIRPSPLGHQIGGRYY